MIWDLGLAELAAFVGQHGQGTVSHVASMFELQLQPPALLSSMPSPFSASEVDIGKGIHIDRAFVTSVQDELVKLQADILSNDIQTIFKSCEKSCECGSQDGYSNDDDDDDRTYCPNITSEDKRTYFFLEKLVPLMKITLNKYSDLITRVSNRAATSRENCDHQQEDHVEDDASFNSEPSSWSDSDAPLSAGAECVGVAVSGGGVPCTKRLTDLPTEVLSNIVFLAQCDDDRATIAFSQVNTTCREFAIETPALWSTINLMHSTNRNTLHLNRSQGSALQVRMPVSVLRTWCDDDAEIQKQLERFVTMLSPFYHRIQSIHALLGDPGETGPLVRTVLDFLFNSNLKRLEVLDFGLEARHDYSTITPTEDLAHKGWPLRHLRLGGLHVSSSNRFFSTYLTELSLCGKCEIALGDLIQILRKSPSLRQLLFKDFYLVANSEDSANQTPALLQDLRTLEFRRVSKQHSLDIITHIRTPRLSSFSFATRDVYFDPQSSIHPVLAAASSNLQLESVDLNSCLLDAEDWSTFFEGLPNLLRFRIMDSPLEEAHFSSLRNNPATCCPKLQTIIIDNELYLTSKFIRAVVEARRPSIQTLVLRGWDAVNVDEEDVKALKGMVRWFTLGTFSAGNLDLVNHEGGSSEEEGWMEDDIEQ